MYFVDFCVGGLIGEIVLGLDFDGDMFMFNILCLLNKGDLMFNIVIG